MSTDKSDEELMGDLTLHSVPQIPNTQHKIETFENYTSRMRGVRTVLRKGFRTHPVKKGPRNTKPKKR